MPPKEGSSSIDSGVELLASSDSLAIEQARALAKITAIMAALSNQVPVLVKALFAVLVLIAVLFTLFYTGCFVGSGGNGVGEPCSAYLKYATYSSIGLISSITIIVAGSVAGIKGMLGLLLKRAAHIAEQG